jgi:hypothetical protein
MCHTETCDTRAAGLPLCDLSEQYVCGTVWTVCSITLETGMNWPALGIRLSLACESLSLSLSLSLYILCDDLPYLSVEIRCFRARTSSIAPYMRKGAPYYPRTLDPRASSMSKHSSQGSPGSQ